MAFTAGDVQQKIIELTAADAPFALRDFTIDGDQLKGFAAAPTDLVQLLHSMTFGLFHAASIEFLRRKVPAARRGMAMALYMSLSLEI